jgi:hypothetical protein
MLHYTITYSYHERLDDTQYAYVEDVLELDVEVNPLLFTTDELDAIGREAFKAEGLQDAIVRVDWTQP